jgi:hypothetical protein
LTYIVFHKKVYETEYTKVSQKLPLSKRLVFKGKTSEISINVDKIIAIEDNCIYTDFHKFDDLIETKEEIVNTLNKYLPTSILEIKE